MSKQAQPAAAWMDHGAKRREQAAIAVVVVVVAALSLFVAACPWAYLSCI